MRILKILLVFVLFNFSGCTLFINDNSAIKSSELSVILQRGKLVALTEVNSINYFIYKGEPMGFHFDLLQAYANHLGVSLELMTESDVETSLDMLENGEVDLLANNLTVTTERANRVSFSSPISQTRQVLVQRKPELSSQSKPVRNLTELGKKIIYVQKGTAASKRLKNLSEEIGSEIVVVELKNYDVDQLIELVANGEIDYTVCDEDVARVNAFYFSNIDIETPVSFEQNLAWAVSKKSSELLANLNEWLENFSKTAEFRIIRSKYFDNPFWAKRIVGELTHLRNGRISRFDEGFKKASNKIDWDWRLFAALVYNESRFKHDAESHKGAKGLMQFMPTTAQYFGIDHSTDPNTQINAGARYLSWLEQRFPDSTITQDQRLKFVLASYNAGIGHVIDARNLARKYGKNPDVWDDNVDYFILNKTRYYRDSIVRHGRLKGVETYRYVNKVFDTYNHYRNIIPE